MKGKARRGHTACRRNKRVLVKLMDGTEFIDRFIDRTGRYVEFKQRGRVPQIEIKTFTIYKGSLHKDLI